MKLTVSSIVCLVLVAGCEGRPPAPPPSRPSSPESPGPAPSVRSASPSANLDGGAAPPTRMPQTPEALAAYARIDAGVATVDGGPNAITGHPRR